MTVRNKLLVVFGVCTILNVTSVTQASTSAPQERTVSSLEEARHLPQPPNTVSGTPIWGAGAPQGNSHGQFAAAFVESGTFVPGSNPNAWTALSVNEDNGLVTPGSAYWTRSLTGYSQGAYVSSTTPVLSPSQANGVAIFDSDFMDNDGVVGAFGTGTSPTSHRGELISPRIDLTGYTNSALSVSLYSFYREFEITKLSVALSTNDGATWSPEIDYRSLIGNLVQDFVQMNFIGVTNGVANLTACRLKLIFEGDYYFAIVDDLTIRTAPQYDLALGPVNPQGNTLVQQSDVLHFTGNRYFPITQLSERNFDFGAVIQNLGVAAVLPAQNPSLQLKLERNVGGTWAQVLTDSAAVTESIPAGGFVSVFDQVADRSWVQVGDYRATYTASFNGTEELSNNSLVHFFTITPDDYASKADRDVNGTPSAPTLVFPGGGPFIKIEYGSVFYFDATTTALRVEGIDFKYRLSGNFSGQSDQFLIAKLYRVDSSTGILDDRNLLTEFGICGLNLTGLGTTVPPGQSATVSCVPVSAVGGAPLSPLTTGHYFVSVSIDSNVPFTFDQVPLFGATRQKNYNLNLYTADVGHLPYVSPIAITSDGAPETWFAQGFGGDVVPAIGVRFVRNIGVFANGFE